MLTTGSLSSEQEPTSDIIPGQLSSIKDDLDGSGVRYTHLVLPYKPELCGLLTTQLWEFFDVYTLVTMDKISEVEVRKFVEQGNGEQKGMGPSRTREMSQTAGGHLFESKKYDRSADGHPAQASAAGYARRVVVLRSHTATAVDVKEMMVRVVCTYL